MYNEEMFTNAGITIPNNIENIINPFHPQFSFLHRTYTNCEFMIDNRYKVISSTYYIINGVWNDTIEVYLIMHSGNELGARVLEVLQS